MTLSILLAVGCVLLASHYEDRQDLLGHKTGKVTTHYSAAELEGLIEAANSVCETKSSKSPALVMLKQKAATAYAITA